MDARFSHGIKKLKVIAHFYNLYFLSSQLWIYILFRFQLLFSEPWDINVEVQEKQSEL